MRRAVVVGMMVVIVVVVMMTVTVAVVMPTAMLMAVTGVVAVLLGVLVADRASKGFLTTTSDFAPKLRDDILLRPYIPAQLELINGTALLARLKELAEKKG